MVTVKLSNVVKHSVAIYIKCILANYRSVWRRSSIDVLIDRGLVGEHLEVGEQLVTRSSSAEMGEQLQFWRKLRERADRAAPPLSDQPPNQYFAKHAIDRQMNEI